jgi:putative sulfotransferase
MMDSEQTVSAQIQEAGTLAAIVVGTGRCGSTLVSRLLREHPAVLSLSEFFGSLNEPQFAHEPMDAAQFWRVLAAPRLNTTAFLRTDMFVPELLYPYNTPTARFTTETGVPPILLMSLPHLTDDYEAVFDELQQVVLHFPPATIAIHYARLFAWLKQRFGRKAVIERSGASLSFVPELARLFPSARFVHLMRDGRDCALSMSRHGGFRHWAYVEMILEQLGLGSQLLREGRESDGSERKHIPADLMLPERIRACSIPLAIFGRLWCQTFLFGIEALLQLPPECVFTLRYEDLLTTPRQTIMRLMDFIDPSLTYDTWVEGTAQMVWPNPSAWQQLPPHEQSTLEATCRPGLEVLDLISREGMSSPLLPDLLHHHRSSSIS